MPVSLSAPEIPAYLRQLFDRAVTAADPAHVLAKFLPAPPAATGRTLLVAAGKAAASMARATELAWPKDAALSGVALTRYGHGMACERIEVIEAAHPVPDNRGHEAAQRLMGEVQKLSEDDLLLCLISGGGSALLALPASGISLDDKKSINKALLMSGAPIGEMNTVRKHLSAIKGGRLAEAAAPARIVTLAISDVPFDDPSTIASGPTVADPTTVADAQELLQRYGITAPQSISNHLAKPEAETPKPGNSAFEKAQFVMTSRPADMLESVVQSCREEGYEVLTLGADIEGEARQVAAEHAALALNGAPGLILSGGETTVTVEQGQTCGRGGRNCEYLLALAITLDGASGIYAVAADTDGIDGSEDNAGAIITPDTLARAISIGLDPQAMLDGHDAYTFFEKLGDLITTGPTRTNVNDFRAIWVS
ncbi:MAG: glycerate kinase [Rhizobiaceae bacterium]